MFKEVRPSNRLMMIIPWFMMVHDTLVMVMNNPWLTYGANQINNTSRKNKDFGMALALALSAAQIISIPSNR